MNFYLNVVADPLSIILLMMSAIVIFASYRYQLCEYQVTGSIFQKYPFGTLIFIAPLYEEIIFRGFILFTLTSVTDVATAVLTCSVVFGLWHLKNLTYQSNRATIYQMLYTGIVLGPILAMVTVWTGSIAAAVFLHALNNFLAPISQKIVGKSMRDFFI